MRRPWSGSRSYRATPRRSSDSVTVDSRTRSPRNVTPNRGPPSLRASINCCVELADVQAPEKTGDAQASSAISTPERLGVPRIESSEIRRPHLEPFRTCRSRPGEQAAAKALAEVLIRRRSGRGPSSAGCRSSREDAESRPQRALGNHRKDRSVLPVLIYGRPVVVGGDKGSLVDRLQLVAVHMS